MKILTVFLIALISTGANSALATPDDVVTLTGVGAKTSCGNYLNNLKESGPKAYKVQGKHMVAYSLYQVGWIQGYITAHNIQSSADKQVDVDSDGVAAWLENYCKANAADSLMAATGALIRDRAGKP